MAHVWIALKGIQYIYTEVYNRVVYKIENNNNKVTWNALIEEFQKISVSEKAQTSFTQIKVETKKTPTTKENDKNNNPPNNNNNNRSKDTSSQTEPYKTYNYNLRVGYKHYNGYGHHTPISPKDNTYW